MRKILLGAVLVVCGITSGRGPALAQQEKPALDAQTVETAMALIRDMAASNSVEKWMAANKAKINRNVALAADRIVNDALSSSRLGLAQAAATFAAFAYLQLGDREAALNSMLKEHDVRFNLAQKPPQYDEVRNSALNLSQKAESIGSPRLTFEFRVLAADCAYFAASPGEKTDGKRLLVALEDIAATLPLMRKDAARIWVERFVSLTSAAITAATSEYFLESEQIEPVLKKIAPDVESAIPADFDYTTNIGNRRKAIENAVQLSDLSYKYGSAALASARLAIAESRANELHDVELALWILHGRYRGERHANTGPDQLRRLRDDAWSRAQTLRANYRSRAGRIWAAYRSDELYGDMLKDQLAETKSSSSRGAAALQIAGALSSAESLKARMLLDRLAAGRVTEIDTPQTRDLERTVLGFSKPTFGANDLTMAEMRLSSQLSGFLNVGGDEQGRMGALMKLEDLYQKAGAGFGKPGGPAPLSTIQRALQPREAVVEYVIPYNPLHPASDLWMTMIAHDQVWSAHVPLDKVLGVSSFTGRLSIDGQAPVDASAVGELVISARTAIRSSDEKRALALLKNLHEVLIQPLLAEGARLENFDRLIVVPHGMLHYVPFPALVNRQGAFLITQVQIAIAPSTSVWSILRSRNSSVSRFVAFANPETQGRPDLPFAGQEATAIAKNAPAAAVDVYRGRDASKDRFVAEAPRASILHFSTHADFPDDNALDLHALSLAGSSDAGALRASDVRKTDLSGAKLVVLNVCNGGLYRIGPSDEPYGLIPAFLEAGAHNVIGTLWRLDDQFGRDFMVEFYKQLQNPDPALAFQQTCKRFISDGEFIRRWAGYVLVGSARPFAPN